MKKLSFLLFMLAFYALGYGQYIYPIAPKPIKTFEQYLKQQLPGTNALADTPTGETPTSTGPSGAQGGVAPPDGDCPPCSKTERVDPYTGNDHRMVKDLEVWRGLGQTPLAWMRYANSRTGTYVSNYGNAHNWTSSYQYDMKDTGTNIFIHYPEGGENVFVPSTSTLWVPQYTSSVAKRLFQYGNDYYLQDGTGFRYHFQKLGAGTGAYYLLQDFSDSSKNVFLLTYDTDHRLTRVTEPAGRYLQINYSMVNGMKVISQVVSSDGRSVQYNYTVVSDGTIGVRLTSVNYGDGTRAVYTYVQYQFGVKPNLEHAIDSRYQGAGANMIYSYLSSPAVGFFKDEKNGVTGQVMATLDTTTFGMRKICYANGGMEVYNTPSSQLGKINAHTDELGNKTQYTYAAGGMGFRTSETDALGRVTTFNSRTIYSNPLEVTYQNGTKEFWTRDTLDLALSHTDELGRISTFTRDANHRITRRDHPDGTFETFTYNSFGQTLDYRKRNGAIEHNIYDSRGLKTSTTDALGNVTSYTYDVSDRLQSMTNALGNTTSYEYNERGLLTKETNADLSFKTYRYDSLGKRDTIINELGQKWTVKYDEFSRVKVKTDPLNRVTTFDYDLPGGVCGCSHSDNHPTKITLASGKITQIAYDLQWRKIRHTNAAGTADEASTFYEYDAIGNQVTVIDPRGKKWITEYDERNRTKSSTDPLGNKTQYTYDAVDNLITMIRPDNGVTTNVYDNMNRSTQTTDANGQVTRMMYDLDGNLIKITDPKNNEYNFQYDALDRKTRMSYPDASFENYTYDVAGNLKTYTNRTGNIQTYSYDSRNRETGSSWNDLITPVISKTYDNASRMLTLTNGASTLTYSYNVANELLNEVQAIPGAAARTVSYSYTPDGIMETITYPGGNAVRYNFTGRNQVKSILADGIPLASYTYDLNGNRTNKSLNNATNTSYTYSDANRLLALDNKRAGMSFARFDYNYDNVNRRSYVKRDNNKGDVYSYDLTDQVVGVQYEVSNPDGVPAGATRTVTYSFDSSGNRKIVNDNGSPTNYISNALNEYVNVGANALTYNSNGSLSTYDGWAYTYDALDRLIKAEKAGTVAEFTYDALDRCVKRTLNSVATFLYYDNWYLVEERNSSEVLQSVYIHGANIDEILIKTSLSNPVYYHQDVLGNVIRLTDRTGLTIEQYSYDIFGSATIRNGAGTLLTTSAYGNRFMFTGREFMAEVGLYDYRTRMYNPNLGRFLQPDPIRFDALDFNLYRYVGNNPINLVDPTGKSILCILDFAQLLAATAIAIGACSTFRLTRTWQSALICAGAVVAALVAGARMVKDCCLDDENDRIRLAQWRKIEAELKAYKQEVQDLKRKLGL